MKSDKKNAESEIFRQAMADVTPLQAPDRIEPTPKNTAAEALQRDRDEQAVMQELLRASDAPDFETGEELFYLRPGCRKRLLQRLRRGHYSVADTIDLHHMDVDTAKQVLADFIERALQKHFSCVRVIHGKGLRSRDLPRLKIMANRMLRKHPRVIAFASCRPVDGGTGATDVLLTARTGKRT